MKVKKLLGSIACVAVSALMVFGIAACGGEDITVTITPGSGSDNTNNENNNNNNNNENNNNENNNNENNNQNPDGENNNNQNPPDEGNNNNQTPAEDTSTKFTGKIYVVGDSTVCSFNDNYYLPRCGYGTQLYNYINVDQSNIVNLALSGRSSKSYLTETEYTTLSTSITAGDYLIIGFGHNDEKNAESARFTDPAGTYTQATTAKGDSFQYVLYQNYVKLAKDKGATPILCTPIVRYDSAGSYTGAKVHNTSDGDYAGAIKALGQATSTTVVDLTTLTKDVYKADNAAAQYFHAHTSYTGTKPNETPTGRDDTHINKYGAKMVAYQFATAIKNSDCALKSNVKTNSVAPTHDTDYKDAIKAEYTKPDYTPFVKSENSNRIITGDWYKTALGYIGGSNASKFTFTTTGSGSDTKITIGNTGGQGKITTGYDGFAAAFMQIDAKKDFEISATVKITSVALKDGNPGADNQSGFGIMLRDDIWIDGVPSGTWTGKEEIKSNYVAAGIMNKGGTIFKRENEALAIANADASLTVAANDTHTMSIVRVGQTVTVTVDSYTQTYTDFDFVAVDNDYMYLCLFANRFLTVEFSNIVFNITGDSQGA